MVLDVATYDAAEREARAGLGYAQHTAFAASTFSAHGFPSRMAEERELFRYIDFIVSESPLRLQGGRFFRDAPVQTDFTADEIALLAKISNAVGRITESACGRRHTVIFNHLSAMGQFRVIDAIARRYARKSVSVFEVGPGCGYVGALLGLTGHRYASYDVAQGLYLWQNRLFAFLFGDDFVEYAGNPAVDCLQGIAARIVHLPWWDFLRFRERCPIAPDVVLSNANLAEMHPLCFKFLLKVMRSMFESTDIGLLVFGNVGANNYGNQSDIETQLENAGFARVLTKWVYAYGLADRTYPSTLIADLERGIPFYDPTGLGKTYSPRDFINLDPETMSEELKFYAFVSEWSLGE